jgi:hypothetical protein
LEGQMEAVFGEEERRQAKDEGEKRHSLPSGWSEEGPVYV